MNGPMPGYGDAATFGPFVVDPSDRRDAEPEEKYTPAGLLHEANRLIARANDAMAAKDISTSRTYLRLLHEMLGDELEIEKG